MKNIPIYMLLLVGSIITSCQNARKEEKKDVIVISEFPKQESVVFKNIFKFDKGVISRIYFKDTALIVYDWRGKGGYFFYEYGLNSAKNIRRYIPHGRGKGKALGSLSAGIYNNSLWMYDVILNKVIFVDLASPSSVDTPAYREFPFPAKYYNIQFLENSKIIANGNYERTNKIQEIDLKSDKITAEYGVLNDVPKDIPFYAWKRANEAFMVLKPTREKVALAHLWSDKIEIFDLKSRKGIMIKGPENFDPEFAVLKSNGDQDLIGRNEKSRVAFGGLMATEKYIYAMFSGNNMSSPYIRYCKTLYVYDWNGKPIKKINFDRYVSSFTVADDDKTLYAFDVASQFVVRTTI